MASTTATKGEKAATKACADGRVDFTEFQRGSLVVVRLDVDEGEPTYELKLRNFDAAAQSAGVVALFLGRSERIDSRQASTVELAKIGLMRVPQK